MPLIIIIYYKKKRGAWIVQNVIVHHHCCFKTLIVLKIFHKLTYSYVKLINILYKMNSLSNNISKPPWWYFHNLVCYYHTNVLLYAQLLSSSLLFPRVLFHLKVLCLLSLHNFCNHYIHITFEAFYRQINHNWRCTSIALARLMSLTTFFFFLISFMIFLGDTVFLCFASIELSNILK